MYGNSNRTTRTPRSANPFAKKSINGVSMPEPAPCAKAMVRMAFFGPSKSNSGGDNTNQSLLIEPWKRASDADLTGSKKTALSSTTLPKKRCVGTVISARYFMDQAARAYTSTKKVPADGDFEELKAQPSGVYLRFVRQRGDQTPTSSPELTSTPANSIR